MEKALFPNSLESINKEFIPIMENIKHSKSIEISIFVPVSWCVIDKSVGTPNGYEKGYIPKYEKKLKIHGFCPFVSISKESHCIAKPSESWGPFVSG